MTATKSSSTAGRPARSQGDSFRGGYAAGKVTNGGSLKPPPKAVTKVKTGGK